MQSLLALTRPGSLLALTRPGSLELYGERGRVSAPRPGLLALFAVTLFLGAVLTFLAQPMVARMVLPLFGGTSAVWTTCVLFFQAGLLAGYGYAHVAPRLLGVRRQAVLHLLVMLLPLGLLPVTITDAWGPPADVPPVLWLLGLLLVVVGLPYVVVTATAPLLQRWFAATGHIAARDPYFLYAASNLGSLLALLSYPFVLEPNFALREHSWIWTLGYVGLILLVGGCVVAVWRTPADRHLSTDDGTAPLPEPEHAASAAREVISWRLRGRWLLLAFVPSSLMLSVTTYLTADIAPIPLLWITPLLLYLLTFIIAFARWAELPRRCARALLPLMAVIVALVLISEATEPVALLMALHLLGFFIIALFCHGELAGSRPQVSHLTEFYLWISVGGVLGGLFNTLLAPLLFTSLAEYPLVLVLACLLRWHRSARSAETTFSWRHIWDVAAPVFLAAATVGLIFAIPALHLIEPLARKLFVPEQPLRLGLIFGVPVVVCYTFVERPLRFALGIAALFAASSWYQATYGELLFAERSFFGIHRVTIDPTGTYRQLVHGNTVHGMQKLDAEHPPKALTYYHTNGPIGRLFHFLDEKGQSPHRVAVIGLGVGSLASYAHAGQQWTFYEIDPVVARIAGDPTYFDFLHDCRGDVRVVLGDARLQLARSGAEKYDLLVVDAFNSDSLPVHLLTREALQLYLEHLNPQGLLAFHISNRYLNLEPVLAELAAAAQIQCLSWRDFSVPGSDRWASDWVVMGRTGSPMAALARDRRWSRPPPGNARYLWTDDYSNLFGVLRWRQPE